MKIGIVGTGQFAGSFCSLWQRHPEVEAVYVTDLLADRAVDHARRYGLAGTYDSFESMLASDCDAVAVMTQRWTHAPLVLAALDAGKCVYSAVPMATTVEDVQAIVGKVQSTDLIYMMGETSYYNPAVVYAREQRKKGSFGRIFYAEGDYVHDMDNGFYAAYQYSGGPDWKATASFPPMLYDTHAVGGVLGVLPTRATSVSCIGVADDRNDGVFDESVSLWHNSFSNMTALFKLADGATVRTNEFRRVGHPASVLESRFRFYGTDAVLEQSSIGATWSTRTDIAEIGHLFETHPSTGRSRLHTSAADLDSSLTYSFISGSARVHDRRRLPVEFDGAENGHEGSHHFLADDFVRAVVNKTHPPLNAWQAARITLPGIRANDSARSNGERLLIPDLGNGPPQPEW